MIDDNRSGLLEDKVFFVAGVGPQIGSATALLAAREGAQVALVARQTAIIDRVRESISSLGGSAIALRCDLSIDQKVRAAVQRTVEEFGRVDAVFYNAGFFDNRHSDLEVDDDLWDTTMSVNLGGAMLIARLTVPSMLANGGGAFVFNSSAASMVAEDLRFGYGVSKAGLNALTRYVAGRYGRQGIRANAILPFVAGGEVGAVAASINCLGRSGTAEEIAEAVVFLCSERASIITGQTIHLDGGLFARAPWPQTSAPRVPPPPR
jgi:NAD(P)-dependent dehydrogenase (short-subunit alcohol dehydrogenase family)